MNFFSNIWVNKIRLKIQVAFFSHIRCAKTFFLECEVCAADPRLRMTEERREGEGRKKAPLGKRVGRRSAATIEPREMDSTAKDFSSSWMGIQLTSFVQKKCYEVVYDFSEIKFSYWPTIQNPLVEWEASSWMNFITKRSTSASTEERKGLRTMLQEIRIFITYFGSVVQRSEKWLVRGWVKFVPALA